MRSLQSLQIPNNINRRNTEIYYLELSHIFRTFIKEEYFIKATEMTSDELEIYFQSIGIQDELIHSWSQTNKIKPVRNILRNLMFLKRGRVRQLYCGDMKGESIHKISGIQIKKEFRNYILRRRTYFKTFGI